MHAIALLLIQTLTFSHRTIICRRPDQCILMELHVCSPKNICALNLLSSVLTFSLRCSVIQCCDQDLTLSIPVPKLTIPIGISQVSIQTPKEIKSIGSRREVHLSFPVRKTLPLRLHPKPTSSSQDFPTSTPRSTDSPNQVLRSHYHHHLHHHFAA
jgi:hypothetical protein